MKSQELNKLFYQQGEHIGNNCEIEGNEFISPLFFIHRAMNFKNSQHLKGVRVLDNNLNLNGGKNKWMNKSH